MERENKVITVAKDSRIMTEFFKGVAIILVILVHSHQYFGLSNRYNAIQRFGQMGCQIFFVLSSYGLCHSFSIAVPHWLSHMKKRISKLAIGYWGAIFFHALFRVFMAIRSQNEILSALNIPGIIINALFLNGFVPIIEINNTIVRGGWYVGTTVMLYALFPLLYKIYFTIKNTIWKKYRTVLFPSAVFLTTATMIVILEKIHPVFICVNNSFAYYSFINQLTPFSLGIVLFDISNRFHNTRCSLSCSLICLTASIILFFGNYQYSFVFCPTILAVAFALLYWYLLNNQKIYNSINKASNNVVRVVRNLGKISYSIYLTHTFIAYEFSIVCLKLLRPIYNNDLMWYIILLPIEFCLIYFVGYIYGKCLAHIKI